MRLCRLILLVVVGLVVGQASAMACKPLKKCIMEGVRVEGVSDVTHLSTSGMNLYVDIENDTRHRLVVSDAEVDILSNGEVLATISLRDKVVVKRRHHGDVLIPLRFKARNTFVLTRLLKRMVEQSNDMAISYRIRGGVGCIKRTMSGESVSLDRLFASGVIAEAMINGISDIVENL